MKRTCKIVDFAVPADHRVKLKESEKKHKHFDLIKELKKTVEHESEEGRGTYWPKRCEHNNKDKDNSPKTADNKNYLTSPQKLRQLN